ncbi:MAG: hypothetical protein IJB74_09590 [Clostridia bacterium]|nr:hypothetical protein [Clostridia bacterium]
MVGDYLFTDREFISRLSAEKPGVFKKIFDEIKYLCRVATAGSKEQKELEKVKKTFEELYRESKTEKNTAEGGVIKYSLMNDVPFEDNVKDIVNMTDEVALKNKEQGNFIRVMNKTPSVILENVKDAGDYEVIIRFDALYLASRKEGVLKGNYHNLGKDIITKLPEFIEDPDAIVRMNDGRLNLYTTIKTPKGNNGIISMEMNAVKDINSKNDKYNLVVTVFSAKDNYIKNKLAENGVKIEYKKEDLSQVNHQLHEWLATVNDKSSANSISDSAENVKQKGDFSLSSKDTAPKKYGDYNVYGEDVMLEGEAKPTGKREFTAPTRESIAEGKKKAITGAPMRADVKNDLLSRSAESFGITKPGDYVQVQRQVFDTLEKEGFFSDEGSRSRTVTNSGSSMQVEINKKGIKETFNYDNYGKQGIRKKVMKLATVRMLPQIIENGKLVSDDVDNYHNSESSNKFAYIEAEVHVEGQPVSVKIDIKKSPQKNKFWVHSVYIKEKVDGLPADTSRVLKRANEHIDSTESISNADENVNSEDKESEQILGESQLRTAEPKKNNIRAAWKSFLRNFVSKGAEVETYALKGKNRAVEDKYKM